MRDITWYDRAFHELSTDELYAILKLRARVFVVEQRCAYLDVDGLDRAARHIWAAHPPAPDELHAYLRLLPANTAYAEPAIGRVIVSPAARGTGLGRELMERGIAAAGPVNIRIGAQLHLERFYGELGFHRASEPYVEDGIPHVEMLRPARPHA